jgi:hypothetical protein
MFHGVGYVNEFLVLLDRSFLSRFLFLRDTVFYEYGVLPFSGSCLGFPPLDQSSAVFSSPLWFQTLYSWQHLSTYTHSIKSALEWAS